MFKVHESIILRVTEKNLFASGYENPKLHSILIPNYTLRRHLNSMGFYWRRSVSVQL